MKIMKKWKRFIAAAMIPAIIIALSACGQGRQNVPAKADDTAMAKYLNQFTAEDKGYIYYITQNGIYKTPRDGSGSKKLRSLTPQNTVSFQQPNYLALHGDWLYYVCGRVLGKIDINGGGRTDLIDSQDHQSGYGPLEILGDSLYVPRQGKLDAYNIKNDPAKLTLAAAYANISDNNEPIICDGWKYYWRYDGDHNLLFREKLDKSWQETLLSMTGNAYIITGKGIFYVQSGADGADSEIWSANLAGENRKCIISNAGKNISLLNYDADWLYYQAEDGFYRVEHDGTGLQRLTAFAENSSIDVVDGWVYIESSEGAVTREKTDGTKTQTAPF
jgi:hypothetical protein